MKNAGKDPAAVCRLLASAIHRWLSTVAFQRAEDENRLKEIVAEQQLDNRM